MHRGKLAVEHNGAFGCLVRRSPLLNRVPHFHGSIPERYLGRCLCNMAGCSGAKVPFSIYRVGEASTEASDDQSPSLPTSATLLIGRCGIRQMRFRVIGWRVEGRGGTDGGTLPDLWGANCGGGEPSRLTNRDAAFGTRSTSTAMTRQSGSYAGRKRAGLPVRHR